MNNSKTCTKCLQLTETENFYNNKENPDGKSYQCKKCTKAEAKIWNRKNREKVALYSKTYRANNYEKVRAVERLSFQKNREKRIKQMRDYTLRLRNEFFDAYGNKCACCGDTHKEFFALDHIHGGGTQEKKKYGTRYLYARLKKEGYPKDKYQILCHNCNMSIGFYGYCPHRPEIKREKFVKKA